MLGIWVEIGKDVLKTVSEDNLVIELISDGICIVLVGVGRKACDVEQPACKNKKKQSNFQQLFF